MLMNTKLRNPVTVLNETVDNTESTVNTSVDLNAVIPSKYSSIFNNLAQEEEDVYNEMNKRRQEYRDAAKAKSAKAAQDKINKVGAVLPNGGTFKPVMGEGLEVEDTPKKTRTKKTKDDAPEVDPRELPDFYEKRFAKPIELVTDIIKEFDTKKDIIEEEISDLRTKSNRNTAILEYISKQDSNVTSLLNNKLSAVKEITNIYGKISDLEMKKANATAKVSGSENTASVISKVYERMMGEKDPFSLNDLYDSGYLKDFNTSAPASYDEAVESDLDRRYLSALQQGQLQETSSDINLKYANRQVEIRVHRSEATDTWRFVAVDLQLEEEIPDYAKPSVIGTMRFDFDNLVARDNLRSYPLVLVPSEVAMDDDIMFISDFTSGNDDNDNGYFGYHR